MNVPTIKIAQNAVQYYKYLISIGLTEDQAIERQNAYWDNAIYDRHEKVINSLTKTGGMLS